MEENESADKLISKIQKIDPEKRKNIALVVMVLFLIVAIVFILLLRNYATLMEANPCQLCEKAGFTCTKLILQ